MVKRGFSLAEALVVMAIVSIFYGAAAKVMSARTQPKKQDLPHGYYECYKKEDNTLEQRTVHKNIPSEAFSVEKCMFTPPTGVSFFNVNTYGGGYYSTIEPQISNSLYIVIGNDNTVTFSTVDGSMSHTITGLQNKTNDQIAEIQQTMKGYIKAINPVPNMYNDGDVRTGVIIDW